MSEKKNERITVWIGSSVKKRLAREAKRLKITLSELAGNRLTSEREVFIAEADRNHLLDTRFQLHKIGADLGQIARSLNMLCDARRGEPLPDLEWLHEVTKELGRRLQRLDQELYQLRPYKPGK